MEGVCSGRRGHKCIIFLQKKICIIDFDILSQVTLLKKIVLI